MWLATSHSRTLEGLVSRFDSFPEIKRVSGVNSDRIPEQPGAAKGRDGEGRRVKETKVFEGAAPFFRWGKRKRARGRDGEGRERGLLGVLAARTAVAGRPDRRHYVQGAI